MIEQQVEDEEEDDEPPMKPAKAAKPANKWEDDEDDEDDEPKVAPSKRTKKEEPSSLTGDLAATLGAWADDDEDD
jgi:hypothetical protein